MPNTQQIANAANPTPFTISTPGNGTVWRDPSNPNSNPYYWNNGQLSALNLSQLGGGNGARPQAGIDALKSQYGVDYNSIPTASYNLADLIQQSSKSTNSLDPGALNPSTIAAALAQATPASQSLTLNGPGSGGTPLPNAPGQTTQPTNNYTGPTYDAQTVNQGAGAQLQTTTGTAGGAPITAAQAQAPQFAQTQALQGATGGATQGGTPSPYGNFTSAGSTGADSYFQNYLSTLAPSAQESALQSQLNGITSQQAGINASRDLGIQGVNEQPIATPFLTGQSTAITNRAAVQSGALGAQAVPLQQQLALAQAKRQSAMDVAKATMDYSLKQQELTKPVFGGYGTTGYQFNPQTGKYEAIAGGGSSQSDDALLGDAQARGLLDASQITKYGRQAIIDTLKQNPNFDFKNSKQDLLNYTTYTKDAFGNIVPVQHFPSSSGGSPSGGGSSSGYKAGQLTALLQSQGKPTDDASLAALYKASGGQGNYVNDTAHNSQIYSSLGGSPSSGGGGGGGGGTTTFPAADAASLKQNQEYADSTQRAFNTANANLKALIPFMQQAGVNSGSNIPLINSLENRYKGQSDGGTIAAFKAALAGLRAEYAQVLSRGGEVTEGQRAQAAGLIPDNLTPQQLQQVADRLNIEGTNAVKEAQAQVQTIKNRVNGVSSPTSSSAGGGSNPIGI